MKNSKQQEYSINDLIETERDLDALLKAKSKEDYFTFFLEAWDVIEPGTPLTLSKHIKYLCDTLGEQVKKVACGERPDYDMIVINVPPSTSKSTIVTKVLPAWVWLQNPTLKIITSSFDDGLSTDHTVKSRDIITSEWYQERWGDVFQLKTDQNEKKRYYNNKTGQRKAVTTKGGKTGFHCHIYIQDDPIDPHKSVSEPERVAAIRDHDQVIPSRLLENGLRILVMQRLHEEDPTGHELKKKKDRTLHICLPAQLSNKVNPPEARELYEDGLLSPERLSVERLASFKNDLGSYGYSGQYDQDPVPSGGGKIKKDWIEYCYEQEVPARLDWDLWVDGAYTKNTENDPTGLMVCAFHSKTNKLYVKHAHDAYLEMPECLTLIEEYADLHELGSKSRVYFEPKATGKSFKQMLNKRTALSCVEIKGSLVTEGKEARIQVASPKFEAGKIVLIRGTWNDNFVGQLTGYPVAKHDEYVDLIGYACEKYFGRRKKKGRMTVYN